MSCVWEEKVVVNEGNEQSKNAKQIKNSKYGTNNDRRRIFHHIFVGNGTNVMYSLGKEKI